MHSIAGFKESFGPSVRMPCRTCCEQFAQFPDCLHHDDCSLRNDGTIRKQAERIDRATSVTEKIALTAQYGLKGSSVLSSLDNFSLIRDIFYDPMHIILEGLIPKEVKLLLNAIIHGEKWLSRNQLNESISKFSFMQSVSKSEIPLPFDSDLTLVASASVALVLILHLPRIIEKYIPGDGCPTLSCTTLLCKITQLFLSPILSSEYVLFRRVGCEPS